jgi:IS30 family transposase
VHVLPETASALAASSTLLNNHEEKTMTTYRQLTLDERYQIQELVKLKYGPTEIARLMARHPSTISRELKRNSDSRCVHPYVANRAMRFAHQRRIAKGKSERKIQGELQYVVESLLHQGWSPEQISGRVRLERGETLAFETIYQHVLRDATGLRKLLRRAGSQHRRFKWLKFPTARERWKKLLEDRPAAANERSELGHWERDLIVSGEGDPTALLTIVDRRSRLTLVRHVPNKECAVVAAATADALAPFGQLNRTITNDNGVEFQRGADLEKRLGVSIYFTAPASPWQRGSVENTNGLIRQFVPKRANLRLIREADTIAIEETLNHRPRKALGFRTPYEAFYGKLTSLVKPRLHFGLKFSRQSINGVYFLELYSRSSESIELMPWVSGFVWRRPLPLLAVALRCMRLRLGPLLATPQ